MQSTGDLEESTTKYTHSRVFAILENKLKLQLTLRKPRAFTASQDDMYMVKFRKGSGDISSEAK